jgi:hypothetical protein
MLTKQINSKYDLIALLQQAQMKKIVAKDIESKDDLRAIIKSAETMAQSSSQLTVFLIGN